MRFVKYEVGDGFDFLPKQPDIVRSHGVHVTGIIKDIADSSGMNGAVPPSLPEGTVFKTNMYMEAGFIWEDIIAMVLKDRLPCRVGEVECDGVYMSPDGFDFEKWELWEYKATWTSMNKLPVDNWRWMTQVKAYCKAMDTLVCNMWILYMNGDYRGSGPVAQRYRIEFTPLEIEENWQMLAGHARRKGWIK